APVRDLRREDFTVREEGVPQTVKYFWQEADLPLTVGLVVDVSGSQAGLVSKHRETVAQFLKQIMGPRDRGVLVTIGPQAKLVADVTNSTAELLAGVDRIGGREGELLGDPCRRSGLRRVRRLGCGGTALWHGLYNTVRLKMRREAGRKALVVISDGWDTGSD